MDALEIMYWKENKSTRDISKELGVCSTTVLYRMKKKGISRRTKSEANKGNGAIEPDLSYSANLSYVLGVILSDGHVTFSKSSPRNKSIVLNTIDEEFVDTFRSTLLSIGLHPCKYIVKGRQGCSNLFRTSAYSLNFYNWYKGLSREEIEKIAFAFPLDFLKGVYDSEGNFNCGWTRVKDKKKLQLYCQVRIFNTDEWLINLCGDLAAYIGFKFRKWKIQAKKEKYKDFYEIALGKRSEIIHFLKMINPSIPRKSIQKYYDVIAEAKNDPERYAKIREIREE